MEFDQLKYFTYVAKHQNLTRAAEILHISQSALSAQIKALEEELGMQLFFRSAKGMKLTKHGEVILEQAQAILDAAKNLKSKARQINERLTGDIRIGLNASPRLLKMNLLNKALSAAMPKVNISFAPCGSLQTAEMLKKQTIDIGFIFGDHLPGNIVVHPLKEVSIVVVIPRAMIHGRPDLDWAEIAALPWIWADDKHPCHRAFKNKLNKHGLRLNKTTDAAAENIISELIKDGQGLGMLPMEDAMALQKQGYAEIWPKGTVEVPLSLTWLAYRQNEPIIQVARQNIEELWSES